MKFYKLDEDKKAVPLGNAFEFAEAIGTQPRFVGEDTLEDVNVTTIFLGIDLGHGRSKKPILFETMILGGNLNGETQRYSTWEEAETGHKTMVELVKTAQKLNEPTEVTGDQQEVQNG